MLLFPSLAGHALGLIARQYGFQLLALGALFFIIAGEVTLHRRAAMIVVGLESAIMGACLRSGGDGATYHGLWAFGHLLAYFVDQMIEDDGMIRDYLNR